MISIVDDDELVRMALGRLMKAHGYRVQTFDSGTSLLNSEHRSRTDCLIADLQMPGMTGLELHRQLVGDGVPLPTILITAHPDETTRAHALRAGVLGYLTKPFSEFELLEYVRLAAGRHEAKGRSK